MQATVETVIKVSGNRKQDPEPEAVPEETPAPSAAKPSESEQGSLNSIIHHSWGHHTDRKAVPEVMPSCMRLLTVQACCSALLASNQPRISHAFL